MNTITQTEVRVAAESVVRRNPTARNTSSLYTDSAGRHCLAGAILEALNLPLPSRDNRLNDANVIGVCKWISTFNPVDWHEAAVLELQRIQDVADDGRPWSDVLSHV